MFPSNYPETDDALEAARLREKLAALTAALVEAREAMQPLKQLAAMVTPEQHDLSVRTATLKAGDLRRAAAWLAKHGETP